MRPPLAASRMSPNGWSCDKSTLLSSESRSKDLTSTLKPSNFANLLMDSPRMSSFACKQVNIDELSLLLELREFCRLFECLGDPHRDPWFPFLFFALRLVLRPSSSAFTSSLAATFASSASLWPDSDALELETCSANKHSSLVEQKVYNTKLQVKPNSHTPAAPQNKTSLFRWPGDRQIWHLCARFTASTRSANTRSIGKGSTKGCLLGPSFYHSLYPYHSFYHLLH